MITTELKGFGVELQRLTADKLELVRQWRNSADVRQYMEFQDDITPEMQQAWFEKIDNANNYYFLLSYNGKHIGVMNLKDIDYEEGTAEKGSLIWEQSLRGHGLGYRANLLVCDFAFNTLKLKKIIIHILSTNVASITLNTRLGFALSPHQEEIKNQEYTLTPEDYLKHRPLIVEKLEVKDTK